MKNFTFLFLHIGVAALLMFGTIEYGTSLIHRSGQETLSADFVDSQEQVVEIKENITTSLIKIPKEQKTELIEIIENADTIEALELELEDVLDIADIENLDFLAPYNGEAVAKIEASSVGISDYLVQGVKLSDLRQGPGVFPGSPNAGGFGNFAIAGHRTTYGAPFANLDDFDPGDEIKVTDTSGIVHTYSVDGQRNGQGHFIVSPKDIWVTYDRGDSSLTLIACHPKRSAAQRIVVTATLVSSIDETALRNAEITSENETRTAENILREQQSAEAQEVISAIEAKLLELRAVPPTYVEIELPSEFELIEEETITTKVITEDVQRVQSVEVTEDLVDEPVEWNVFSFFAIASVFLWAAGYFTISYSRLVGMPVLAFGFLTWFYAGFPLASAFGI